MIKKFDIVSRGDILSDGLANAIRDRLKYAGWQTYGTPDIVLSIGGDGTMLHAFHKYSDSLDKVAFVGLHTGHLGFYTDWKQADFEELLNHLINDEPTIVEYPLVELTFNDGEEELEYLAVNEIYLKSPKKSLICSVYINGDHFENFRGDGLCISTPSGSTAYNKALNGSIVHPSLEAIQLSEMASVNNNVFRTIGSSIILPKHHTLEIHIEGDSDELVLGADHTVIADNFSKLKLRVSNKKIRFARCKRHTFWNRVKESFV
ncbi:MAG: ppnK [Bacillales bacterium]|jgi:NAD+ kinase|nr:ppnK [Bacillales bacterium]